MPTPATQALSARLVELAQTYRRLHDLLRSEFPSVNHKKIYRLHEEAQLKVRKHRKAKLPVGERQQLLAACAPNYTWSMEFVIDALANARRIQCLTAVDDFTRENVDIALDHGISGAYVVCLLDQAACFRGYPRAVRTDKVLTLESSRKYGCKHLQSRKAPDRDGRTDPERLYRKLQRQVARRVPQRTLVHIAGAGTGSDR